MLSLTDIAEAYEAGRQLYNDTLNTSDCGSFRTEKIYGKERDGAGIYNYLATGDNLEYMRYLIKKRNMAGKLQLVYVDPPFFSGGKYSASIRLESEILGKSSLMKLEAYDDMWSRGMKQYLIMLTARLLAMKELLSETGCIWMHLDWHGVYYVKVIMDQIFGEGNFINEVIWTYKSGGSSKRSFAKKHDTLLVYGKNRKYKFNPLTEKSYNRDFKPYRFKGIEEFCDDVGWYTRVNMKDVWSIDMVGRTSAERTGYATQKPEKLMERIIASCTDEGDLCADFFAGSGTMGAVCERMGRKWIMCDEGELAAAGQIHRLGSLESCFCVEEDCRSGSGTAGGILKYAVSGSLIRLLSYEAQIPDVPEAYRDELSMYLREDSLSMIKCWSAGRTGSDGIYRAYHVINDSWGVLELSGRAEDIVVSGYDVFGRRVKGIREE